jgi:hypothetical protein
MSDSLGLLLRLVGSLFFNGLYESIVDTPPRLVF